MKKLRNVLVLLLLTILSTLYISRAAYATENELQEDTVSTGPELVAWMESHIGLGGTVSLANDITLGDTWYYVPYRPGQPAITVDTNGFSITVTGEISFLSDDRLTFYGTPDEKEVFRVAAGGLLFLEGCSIEEKAADPAAAGAEQTAGRTKETGGYVLVQEEGAGLVVQNCTISGDILYAQMPLVVYNTPVTAVASPGQEAADVLPDVIASQVIRNGQKYFGEEIPVTWETAGTEQPQQERRRFTVQGTFEGAASLTPPVCTVAYNDAPLTFTDVSASVSYSVYVFRGGYTKPEERLPIKVAAEYSFDQSNWILYDTDSVSDVEEPFFIGVAKADWDASANPYIYIRLRCSDGGEEIYSNVLRFAVDDLSKAEDQGGNRGGGTAIVNPPKEPVSVPDPPASPEPEKDNGSSDEPGEGEADSDPKNISVGSGWQGKTPVISSHVLSDKNKKNTEKNAMNQKVSRQSSGQSGNKAGNTKTEGKPADGSNISGNIMDAGNTRKEQTEEASGSGQLADATGDMEKPDTVEKINADENRKDSGNALIADDRGKYKADFLWVLLAAVLVLGAAAGVLLLVRYRRMR